MTRLGRDARGATLAEYIILLGVVALVATAGFRLFGTGVIDAAKREADCVGVLSGGCAGQTQEAVSSRPESRPSTRAAPFRNAVRKSVFGLVTGSLKWAYNSVAGTLAFVDAPIDWALRKAGVRYQVAPRLLPLSSYETGVSAALDVATIAPAVAAKLPVIVRAVGSAYDGTSALRRALRAREGMGGDVSNAVAQATDRILGKPSWIVRALAPSWPETSPEYWAMREGHVLVRTEEGTRAAKESPSVMIYSTPDLDHNGAIWLNSQPKRVVLDPKHVIGIDGKPVTNMRQVASYDTHGAPSYFAGWTKRESETANSDGIMSDYSPRFETDAAARMAANVIVRENEMRAPEDRIRYLVLASCHQGTFVGGATNAQRFQAAVDEFMAGRGPGTDRIVVLAADHGGVLYAPKEEAGAMSQFVKLWYRPVHFIPAETQVPQPSWHTSVSPAAVRLAVDVTVGMTEAALVAGGSMLLAEALDHLRSERHR